MPRIGRIILPNYPHHIVQRGHDRNEVFVEDVDYRYYLETLSEFKEVFDVKVYAYCLMTNHVHLLLEPSTHSGIGQIMKRLAGRQTRFRNRQENRRGTLWEGRYKSSVVDADDYLMACVRYIEMNPVRAWMVNKPEQYQWSSYGLRLKGATNKLLNDLPVSSHEYISYMNISSPPDEWELIRSSVQSNHVTGSSMFCKKIERAVGRRLQFRNPGRPKKCIQ